MIAVQALKKSYGDFAAVRGISFQVQRGEVVGLLGPNGAGKSTTMRMLTTYLSPTSGSASVAGYDIRKQSDQVRAHIGYLPENPPLYPELRVHEYLTFMGSLRNIPRKTLPARVSEVMERCFLSSVSQRLCGQLSKGYRQRVGLAQAIIHDPDVVILDEPTSGLDPAQIIDVRSLIRSLGEKHTVILSTHILPEVSETCSRVIIMANGQIVVEGSLSDLTKEHSLEESFLQAVTRQETPHISEAV